VTLLSPMTLHSLRYASLSLLVQIHGEPVEQVVSGRLFLLSSLSHQDRNCSWKIKFSRFRWKGCNFSRIECVFFIRATLFGQRVVDGHFEFVGSDERRALLAIESVTKAEKVPVSVSAVHPEAGNRFTVHVETGQLPSSLAAGSAEVLIATADESDESHVSRGGNAGRTLKHIAVLRSLTQVGTAEESSGFSSDVSVKLNHSNARSLRGAAVVKESTAGVLGVDWLASRIKLAEARTQDWLAAIFLHIGEGE
jgi:hypothetical protein